MTSYEEMRNDIIKKSENSYLLQGNKLDEYATIHYPNKNATIGYGYDIAKHGFTDSTRNYINGFATFYTFESEWF